MKVKYVCDGETCVAQLGQPVPSGHPNEFMVTVHTEGSGKLRTIYAMTEADAVSNAMGFLRALSDDESIVILDD